ncbi:MAG TPA: polysaccharide biosynthesis tyrosine autokinase [Pyrinomonadaceae bacterium]|nr:polysaccharide biosynthesis tyrosine autokinase [Pyrinomonadaceae bacterium]
MFQGNTPLLPPSNSNKLQPTRLLDQKYEQDYVGPYQRPRELSDYLSAVTKRKWLIMTLVLVGTTMAALYVMQQPAVYEATTVIRIEQQTNNFLQTKEVFYTFRSPEYWNTQIQTLRNPHLMYQVAAMLDLPHNRSFLTDPKERGIVAALRRLAGRSERDAKPVAAPTSAAQLESVPSIENSPDGFSVEEQKLLAPYVAGLSSNLSINPVEESNLVAISFRHGDPDTAMKVADAVAYVFMKNDVKRETGGSLNAADKLAREIATLQLSIRQLEEQRINYLKNHDLPLGQAKGQNLTVERLGTLSGQLLAKEHERKNLQAAYEGAQKAKDIWSVPEVHEDREIKETRKNLADLERRRAELLVTYTAEWPEVKKIDAQIKSLKEDLDKSAAEALSILKARYDAALDSEKQLQQVYSQERGAANQQSQSEIMLSSLNQQLETNKQLSNTLFQRQKEMEIAANGRNNSITVASPAAHPDAPLPQGRLGKTFIAFLLSLTFGVGLAFLLDHLDNTLKSADDVAVHLQLHTLAMIPGSRRRTLTRWRKSVKQISNGGGSALELTKEMRSPTAEAYRQLRTSLRFCSVGAPPKRILITSGQSGDGKTTTAINAAITLAQSGADVLLVDCDLRRPRVHDHFELSNDSGLTNYLCGQQVEIDELLKTYEDVPKLKIMTAGPMPANPADFLGSDEMVNLLNIVSDKFTHVILDSPPASAFADAALLSTLVDGVVIVVDSGRSSRTVARRVKQRLSQVGARIYGVVINYSDLEADEYYSGYYSDYYAADQAKAPTNSLSANSGG